MFLFIPSWYSKQNKWKENSHPWYVSSREGGFDDTVNQIRTFREVQEDIELVVLAHSPNLRHFLHRQGLIGVNVWSLFDEIQGITGQDLGILTYKDLYLPEDLEWNYGPYATVAFRSGKPYVRVDYTEDGTMYTMDFLTPDQQTVVRMFYDDRGFLSSVLHYHEGEPVYEDYLNPAGLFVIRYYFQTGAVSVNPVLSREFEKTEYDSMEELILERLDHHIKTVCKADDSIILAADPWHDALVEKASNDHKIILSFFGDRYNMDNADQIKKDIRMAAFVATDTDYTREMVLKITGTKKPIYDISPFDTRMSLGVSQRMRELNVFFPVEDLADFLRIRAMDLILRFMLEHPNVNLILGTDRGEEDRLNEIRAEVEKRIANLPEDNGIFIDSDADEDGENDDVLSLTVEKEKPRVSVKRYLNEMDVIQILNETRLVVDIRDIPDLYIQIAGISSGIPQVNYRNTRYIAHKKNGYMIHNIASLTDAMEYYLIGLQHWNEALVNSVKMVQSYTSGSIVERWKAAIQENDSADGQEEIEDHIDWPENGQQAAGG